MCDWKCPNCGKCDHSGCDMGFTTAMYFPPHYVDGINVNPDRNSTSGTIHCHACDKRYSFTRGHDFFIANEIPSKPGIG